MKPLRRNRLGNERGGALVMVAISLVVLLGMAALAVDLTAGYAWRNEAQKIADSAALAGGSAFLDFPLAQVTPFARERAYDYALRHTIKNEPVDSSEVTVEVLLAEKKVVADGDWVSTVEDDIDEGTWEATLEQPLDCTPRGFF